MMEKMVIKMNIDKNTKRLIIFDLYVLSSIVSAGLIYEIFKDDFVEVHTPVIIGLVIGLVATVFLLKLINAIVKTKGEEND